jgi:hypothetical protein
VERGVEPWESRKPQYRAASEVGMYGGNVVDESSLLIRERPDRRSEQPLTNGTRAPILFKYQIE